MTTALQNQMLNDLNLTVSMPITITDAAANKVSELIVEEGDPKLMLRAYVQGGGCSGFQYGFTFDSTINTDDTIVEKFLDNEGIQAVVKLVVDAMSLQYLVGAEIDYKKDLSGEQFIIRNPNAKTTCGCGSSFTA